MGLSIMPVGGYDEVGKNCTAVKVDDEIFLLDLGLQLENYIRVTEDDDLHYKISKKMLIREGAIPDISVIDRKKVKGVLISHAHLDHVGALPFLGNSFSAPVYGTPFTISVAGKLLKDKRVEFRDELVSHEYREIFPISETVSAEFIEVTHSTPHTAAIALHTPYGVVLYLNDFKLDKNPTLGNVTDIERLRELDVKVLLVDTLYADLDAHTPSESDAKQMLEDALLSRDLSGKHVIASTFSSQIARLESLAEIGKKLNRKVMFVGRSMCKYLDAAKEVGISSLIDDHESIKYGSTVRKMLAKVGNHKEYLFVVTGGMAEPRAVLSRIVDEKMLPLSKGDVVVFSNRAIPVDHILEGREKLEAKLKAMGFEVLKDLHASGHAAGKDLVEILDIIKPEIVLPVHGEAKQREAFREIASSYNVILLENEEEIKI